MYLRVNIAGFGDAHMESRSCKREHEMPKNLKGDDFSMGRKCFLLFKSGLLLMMALLPAAAWAQNPWQWQMSLRIDQPGDSMYMPSAIAFDTESERYYAVDTGRNRLVSFDRNGKMLRAFTADEQLKAPFDMVRLNNGKLWVVEKGRNSLTLIDVAGREVKPHILKDGKRQVFPDRIGLGGGKLHVLDRASGQVLRLDNNLAVEQRFGCANCTAGLADFVIHDDSVIAIEPRERKIFRFHPDGRIAEEIKLGDEAGFPVSLAVESSGFIYVLDRTHNSVLAYSGNGRLHYRFLGPGQSAGKIHFARQLRFDPWGRLCVVDEGNGRVEIYGR
jgi:sugar lactone lactonase YvrE